MDTPNDRLVTDLDEAECFRLAATEPLGRLAWTGPDGPAVVPVNFAIEDGAIHIRTAAYSALARECDDSRVAFEIDAYDADSRLGWSVVMVGRARVGYVRPGSPAPDVWPVGSASSTEGRPDGGRSGLLVLGGEDRGLGAAGEAELGQQ